MHIPESVFEAATLTPQTWEDERGFVYLVEWDETRARALAQVVGRPPGADVSEDWPEEGP